MQHLTRHCKEKSLRYWRYCARIKILEQINWGQGCWTSYKWFILTPFTTLLLNSEAECTQVTINLFQGLQVFFLGFNPDFVTVCILFACSAFTTSVFDHRFGFPGCQCKGNRHTEGFPNFGIESLIGYSIKGRALSWSAGSHSTINPIEGEI